MAGRGHGSCTPRRLAGGKAATLQIAMSKSLWNPLVWIIYPGLLSFLPAHSAPGLIRGEVFPDPHGCSKPQVAANHVYPI